MPVTPAPAPVIVRTAGTHAATGIDWVIVSLAGRRVDGPQAAPPLLAAQCSRSPAGKLKFELLATDPAASGAETPTFQPPWRPLPDQLFPPSLAKVNITMNFLGYTHVKPVKRQWERPDGSSGLLRYSTPSLTSSNMEEIAFYLQYLRALPTLRLTLPTGQAAEFETTAFQQAVHAEPLCKASGL